MTASRMIAGREHRSRSHTEIRNHAPLNCSVVKDRRMGMPRPRATDRGDGKRRGPSRKDRGGLAISIPNADAHVRRLALQALQLHQRLSRLIQHELTIKARHLLVLSLTQTTPP